MVCTGDNARWKVGQDQVNKDELSKKYWDTTVKLTKAVENWSRILNDPYRPPELKTGLPPNVSHLVFEQTALYHALCNYTESDSLNQESQFPRPTMQEIGKSADSKKDE